MRRYSLVTEQNKVEHIFGLDNKSSVSYSPFYNISPTLSVPVISCKRPNQLSLMYWGLSPKVANNNPVSDNFTTINHINFLDKYNKGRKLLNSQRVIIPADSIYLFKQIAKRTKVPYRLCLVEESVFAIAGIFEQFTVNGTLVNVFKMVTKTYDTNENLFLPSFVKPTDLMPFVLPYEAWQPWIYQHTSINDLELILENHFFPNTKHYPVTHKVTIRDYNYPDVILKVLPMNNRGEYTLFD